MAFNRLQSSLANNEIQDDSTQVIHHMLQSPKQNAGTGKSQTLYDILDVAPTASAEQIKSAYTKLALKHHPDKGGNAEEFKKIQHAYSVLSKKEERRRYDEIMNNTDLEKQYTSTSFATFVSQVYDMLEKELDDFEIRAKTDTSKSAIILGESPIYTNWHLPRQLKNAQKNDILYSIGKPIQISKKPGKFRDNITTDELLTSFPQAETILLFSSKESATHYTRASRIGNFYLDEQCFESPIITVKLLENVPDNVEVKQLTMFINDRHQEYGVYAELNRFYITLPSQMVEPMTAVLEIHTAIGHRNFPQAQFQPSFGIAELSRCRIM